MKKLNLLFFIVDVIAPLGGFRFLEFLFRWVFKKLTVSWVNFKVCSINVRSMFLSDLTTSAFCSLRYSTHRVKKPWRLWYWQFFLSIIAKGADFEWEWQNMRLLMSTFSFRFLQTKRKIKQKLLDMFSKKDQ